MDETRGRTPSGRRGEDASQPAPTVDEVALSPMRWAGAIPAQAITPDLLDRIDALAETYLQGGKDETDAPLLALLEKNLNRHGLCVALGERIIESGDVPGGLRYLRLALEFDADQPGTLLRVADLFDSLEAHDEASNARSAAVDAIRLEEIVSQAEVDLGMRHFDAAIAGLERAARLGPGRGELLHRLGDALMLVHRHSDAVPILRTSLERVPAEQRHIPLYSLGQALYGDGRFAEALSVLKTALAEGGRLDAVVAERQAGMVACRIPFRALRDHCAAHECKVTPMGEPEEDVVAQPRYAPEPPHRHDPVRITFPAPAIFELRDAEVLGNQGVVVSGGHVLFDGPNHRPDLEQHNVDAYTGYAHTPSDTVVMTPSRETLHVKEAILLCGRASGNWFHWVLEDLPRLLLIDQIPRYRHLPVLVSNNVLNAGSQLLESVCRSRQIVPVPPKARVRVDRLVVSSALADLPDGPQAETVERRVSACAVNLVRSRFMPKPRPTDAPPRLFLRRAESFTRRSCVNENEIGELLHRHGFIDVAPETLDVDEQIRLYAGAEAIACTMGAAMTNLVWANPACRVLCLFKGEGRGPYLFNTVARTIGIDPVYARGVIISGSNPTRIHSDFWMPPDHAREGLERALSAAPKTGDTGVRSAAIASL
jgi:capsular polysaccharide biosynthesis protein